MITKNHLKFICCPQCKKDLAFKGDGLFCFNCQKSFKTERNIPILLPEKLADDLALSQKKWDEEYQKTIKSGEHQKIKRGFEKIYLDPTLNLLKEISPNFKNKVYLEIGCGPFFMGQKLAKLGAFVIGIDFSLAALKLAQFFLKEEKIKNYLLICGDITKMPLRDNTCDLLWGGGVIEHFQDTQVVVSEIYRVLKKGGVALNTVPILNLGSLTYRQLWGNIPNLPILKQLAELIHIRVLGAKHMIGGYELSFTKSQMRKAFAKAGFKEEKIEIGNFRAPLLLEYLQFDYLKKLAAFLASKIEFFWPMMYIKATK